MERLREAPNMVGHEIARSIPCALDIDIVGYFASCFHSLTGALKDRSTANDDLHRYRSFPKRTDRIRDD